MSSRGTQLLTRVFEPGDPRSPFGPSGSRSAVASALSPVRDAVAKPSSPSRRRTPISDLHQSLHCSIIGTCLSAAELRRLLVRLKIQGTEICRRPRPAHDRRPAGRPPRPGRQASCKRRSIGGTSPTLNQFAKAKDAAAVAALWEEAHRARRHSGRLLGSAHPSGGDRQAWSRMSSARCTCSRTWWGRQPRRHPHACASWRTTTQPSPPSWSVSNGNCATASPSRDETIPAAQRMLARDGQPGGRAYPRRGERG